MASPLQDGFLTEDQRDLLRSISFGSNIFASEASSPRGSFDLLRQGSNASSVAAAAGGKPPTLKHDRRSHSGKLGRPKKGGAGGRGTWGSLLETGGEVRVDRNDPNYNSEEVGV